METNVVSSAIDFPLSKWYTGNWCVFINSNTYVSLAHFLQYTLYILSRTSSIFLNKTKLTIHETGNSKSLRYKFKRLKRATKTWDITFFMNFLHIFV